MTRRCLQSWEWVVVIVSWPVQPFPACWHLPCNSLETKCFVALLNSLWPFAVLCFLQEVAIIVLLNWFKSRRCEQALVTLTGCCFILRMSPSGFPGIRYLARS